MFIKKYLNYFAIILIYSLLNACSSSIKPIVEAQKTWQEQVQQSAVFSQNHTGFALYDLEKNEMVAQYNAEKYFTPASNTKLFSFYAGLSVLGDSIPAFRYRIAQDSLLIFPTGDPSFLHQDLKITKAFSFLKNRSEQIYLQLNSPNLSYYGAGWAWDDYNDDYQPEISSFPLYGNIVRFRAGQPSIKYWQTNLERNEPNTTKIVRDFHTNAYTIPSKIRANSVQDVAFKTSKALTISLLEDTLKKNISLLPLKTNQAKSKLFYSMPSDSLYKRMLQVSDNMLAEQLMVMVSGISTDTLSTEKGIDFVIKNHLSDLPDAPQWVDGSGLSRYNLFTPRSLVKLLQKIYAIVPQQRLFSLLAIGGKAGTLRNLYQEGEPFIYAKSGSLSNNYNLSGYLITKKNKVLIFSIMNNNYVKSTSEIRKEVERILTTLHNNY